VPIIGILRIKNEARWIERVIRSVQPACEAVIVLDDHSQDGTPEICEAIGCEVHRSEFAGIDESRDRDYLLSLAFRRVPAGQQNAQSPWWALAIDGDEELVAADVAQLRRLAECPGAHAYAMQILYLWDRPDQWRCDGVYARFSRPSMFRLMNAGFRYLRTPFGNGANFHCSSIPQELLHHARPSGVRLLHWGYMEREDRLRKYAWYNRIDPNNRGEDQYRHIVQGDVPGVPASARLMHAGPLTLRPLSI
jgi:glycosyltransferase involved in cell wall biosynthesis